MVKTVTQLEESDLDFKNIPSHTAIEQIVSIVLLGFIAEALPLTVKLNKEFVMDAFVSKFGLIGLNILLANGVSV